ncbi:MAG TPA: ScyD/ScyE family protein [Vicinamibacterales bacterium]
MIIHSRWRKLTRPLIVLAVVGAFAGTLSGLAADPSEPIPLIVDLNGPRGVAAGPLGIVGYAENDGSFSALATRGPFAGTTFNLGSVPPTYIAPSMAIGSLGQTYVLTAGGPPGSGAATLYRWVGSDTPRVVADIAKYQATDPDPYNLADDPGESNPFNVAVLPDGSVLVSDAAANDLLRVFRNGRIVTVARLKPRVVKVPDELPDVGFPPAGTPLPSEAVATSVTVGADGYYYVGELRGFPATPGMSQIWRIAPDSVNAVCDPEAPRRGRCQRYADGFTSIVALGAGRDGSIYVVELVKRSWLQWELELVDPPVGGLFRIPPGGGHPQELAADQLILPAGVAVSGKNVYLTGPVFGPGTLSKIRAVSGRGH